MVNRLALLCGLLGLLTFLLTGCSSEPATTADQPASSDPTTGTRATATPVPIGTTEPAKASTQTPGATPSPVSSPMPSPTPPGSPPTAESANVVTATATPAASIAPSAGDREALVALYRATGGPDWRNRGSWLSSAEIGDWYGVTADADGRVIALDLRSNRLEGELPSELGDLGNLKELTLRKNRLHGEIPPELVGLTNLEVLDFYVNELSGEIPPGLGSLANLRKLDLGYNRLSGAIPPELGSLANLEDLRIILNELTGKIPPQLGGLANLRDMDLSVNRLEGELPSELGKLSNVVVFDVAANQLRGEIPPELGNLTRVEELKLGGNDLTGEIPPELGNLDWLLVLSLSGNALSGCIPDTLRIHYYLAEELDMGFCDPSEVSLADGSGDKADYLGPNTEYIDPALVALLYDHAAGEATSARVRLAIVPRDFQEASALEAYIEGGGGTPDGEYGWLMPIGLVPSVVCRPDVAIAGLVDPDGMPGWESRDNPYHNLNDALSDVVAAHQGGMPENQAALYALFVRGNSVAVIVQTSDAETEGSVLDWLAQRNIYVRPNASSSDGLVGVLLPVGQILPLAQRFPGAYLNAEDKRGQGLPMLRSQWPVEALFYEKSLTQQLLSPDSDAGRIEPGRGIMPCSLATAGS